jgi:hypothetical protein
MRLNVAPPQRGAPINAGVLLDGTKSTAPRRWVILSPRKSSSSGGAENADHAIGRGWEHPGRTPNPGAGDNYRWSSRFSRS